MQTDQKIHGLTGRRQRGWKGIGHPIMFGLRDSELFDPFPDGGGFPKGFLKRAFETLGVDDPLEVLHVCSGSMRLGITVDIRRSTYPMIVADCRRLPFVDNMFRWAIADPPYGEDHAENLYGTGKVYPKPGQIVRELGRVVRPGGRFGILHLQVPKWQGTPVKLVNVYAISQGPGYGMRAWSVFQVVEEQCASNP